MAKDNILKVHHFLPSDNENSSYYCLPNALTKECSLFVFCLPYYLVFISFD